MSAKDFSGRVGVSLATLCGLERGDVGISTSVLATGLWALGPLDPVQDAVSQKRDPVGVALEVARLPAGCAE